MRAFSQHNPIAVFVTLAFITLMSMFALSPLLLLFSLLGAAALHFARGGKGKECWVYLLFPFLMGLGNPLFNHNGVTVLFILNDNPVTLEAVYYGLTMGTTVAVVLWWFRSFSAILTSDKLLYLFGAVSPKLALILSMTLRYIPLFHRQAAKTRQAQRALGLYGEDSLPERLRGTLRVFSVMVTWALENGVITADSMTARAYGVGRRTQFSLFRFRRGDALLLGMATLLTLLPVLALLRGALGCAFYPRFVPWCSGGWGVLGALAYGLLCLLPSILEFWEGMRWRSLRCAI